MTFYQFPGNFRVGVLNESQALPPDPRPAAVDPKDMLFVLLNGYQRFRIDGRIFELRAEGGQADALLLRVERRAELQYLERRGTPLVKMAISTDPDWLDGAGLAVDPPEETHLPLPPVAARLSGHLSARHWRPDIALRDRCQDVVTSAATTGTQDSPSLLLMARGIEIYRRALVSSAALNRAAPETRRQQGRLRDLEAEVARHLDDAGFSPDLLARACGMSLRSLQRLCREMLDCSPRDFIRARRMQAARSALEQGGASVTQAAWIAGYSSAANFGTAFKRAFGVTPGHLRRADAGAPALPPPPAAPLH